MSKGLKFQRRISIVTAFAAFNVLWCELETWVEYENTKPVGKLPREMIFWEIYGWEQNILLLRHSAWLRKFEKHTSSAIVFQQTEKRETGDTVNKILKINGLFQFSSSWLYIYPTYPVQWNFTDPILQSSPPIFLLLLSWAI